MRSKLGLGVLLVALASCAVQGRDPPARNETAPPRALPFELGAAQRESLARRPELEAKIRGSAYTYFRLISDQFAQHVCDEFADSFLGAQTVNLHGDAHLEQFAVTNEHFGLDDYDRGGFGPAAIDLVRFSTSIHVACQGAAYDCDPERAVAAFLDEYRAALDQPERAPVTPSIVTRLRALAPSEPGAFARWAEGLMKPVTDEDLDRRVRARWKELVAVLTKTRAKRSPEEFRIVRYGTTGIGIGSALELKFLFRVVGPSDSPEDDLMLEMKAVPPAGASCVYRGPSGGMFLPLLPAARISRAMPEIMAYVPLSRISRSGLNWWVRAWEPGRRELSVSQIVSQAELVELARDAGLQLGRGHCSEIGDPLEEQFRDAQQRSFDTIRPRVVSSARAAARDTVRTWQAWRAPAGPTK